MSGEAAGLPDPWERATQPAMLNRIRAMFELGDGFRREHVEGDPKTFAAAVLMVEAARMDDHYSAAERRVIGDLLQRNLGLSTEEAETLLTAAEAVQAESNQLHRFTLAVKDHYNPEERIEVVEMLWEIAYSDGQLHDYEASLLRRICGLIYVSDRDSGAARKRVLARLGLG